MKTIALLAVLTLPIFAQTAITAGNKTVSIQTGTPALGCAIDTTAAVGANNSATLAVSCLSGGKLGPAGIQSLSVSWNPPDITAINFSAGSSAASAGKQVQCNSSVPPVTCIIVSTTAPLNNNIIPDGPVLLISVTPKAGILTTPIAISGLTTVSSFGIQQRGSTITNATGNVTSTATAVNVANIVLVSSTISGTCYQSEICTLSIQLPAGGNTTGGPLAIPVSSADPKWVILSTSGQPATGCSVAVGSSQCQVQLEGIF